MYKRILVPVDLSHTDKMSKALQTAIDMARHYSATLHYVTVTSSAPSSAAHNPQELAQKLATFAQEQGETHGIDTTSQVIESVDTAVELEDKLLEAISDSGADLVVLASHPPGIGDRLHILHSNAANIVRHSDVSVFVVR
ncbi:nucleotide-binding universal stress UspA family protein [Tamilnaduibacter salinus]|uniref:Nucleotide-binding universal stress UspA family protein n=1 Tax=Tamilnaduibacter salinus TaxID=1484056 RepID=A0A2A2I495_9GAMM|nr:universal stress protein [Tamilnaduibacter salinus]PAV26487.1 universal stress protein UspA [Tamilnaduibacter salinus]PVY79182.1 nucleotide-binding universal stress UspA family protein [Tamilnaduibacter salinus]